MDLYIVTRQQIDHVMQEQFQEAPETAANPPAATPRAGIAMTMRLRLGTGLRALAAAIEPRQSLSPEPSGSHR